MSGLTFPHLVCGVPLTLGALRKIARPSPEMPVPGLFEVFVSPDLEEAAMDLPNFVPCEKYATMKPKTEDELGVVEVFRVRTDTDLPRDSWRVERVLR